MRARLPEGVRAEELRAAVEQVVRNHPELFVHFRTNDTGVEQLIDKSQELRLETIDLQEAQLDAYRAEFVQPFNLSKDQLFRFSIVQTEKALYLYCDMHHLVCDGASYDVFFNELCALLNGGTIEPEMCSYAEFVADEQAAEDSAEYAAAKEFFVIDPAGQIRTCNHSPKVVGNIFDEEIIHDKGYWNIFANSNYHPAICQSCKSIDMCDCGCREVANILYHSPSAVDDSTELYEARPAKP